MGKKYIKDTLTNAWKYVQMLQSLEWHPTGVLPGQLNYKPLNPSIPAFLEKQAAGPGILKWCFTQTCRVV